MNAPTDPAADLVQCRKALREMVAQISQAQDDERHRIAQGIHDDLGQLLATVTIRLEHVRRSVGDEQLAALDEVDRLVAAAIESSRTLAFEMISPVLAAGIEPSIAAITERLEKRCGIRCRFTTDGSSTAVSADAAAAIFRVVRELLTNIARHSAATKATVHLAGASGRVVVTVTDNGKGFVPAETWAPERGGVGLLIVQERMAAVNGTVDISSEVGRGTRITVVAPQEPAAVYGVSA